MTAIARSLGAQTAADDPSHRIPEWLTLHFEQRVRFETSDTRYRLGETGGDQQMGFRTRLQTGVHAKGFTLFSEIQDSRVAFTDSGSTVNSTHETRTRLLQGYAGYRWKNASPWNLQITAEVGRFSRDFGSRRLIGRNVFRNTTNAFDGLMGTVSSAKWSLQGFAFRPVFYTYPAIHFDPRYRHARMLGLFFTGAAQTQAKLDLYAIHMNDGDVFPAASRRRFTSFGFRWFGSMRAESWDYEIEHIWQTGTVGARDHFARLHHVQAGYTWPIRVRPRASVYYDYASGDKDPSDNRDGAFDTLFGPRRFEFGPTGTWALISRANLNSPAVQISVKPAAPLELSVNHRGVWLAQKRDIWRGIGLSDPGGRSGNYVGQQTEFRLRYRWQTHFEFDTGYVLFHEGSFVRRTSPKPVDGWGTFFFVTNEWKF